MLNIGMLWEELKSCELKHPKLDANDDWKSQLISDEDYEFWGILFFYFTMKLAALFSGGKDSTYAIHLAKKHGHSVDVLLTIFPHNDESHLLHYPNIRFTSLQSESMKIPQLTEQLTSTETKNESEALDRLILSEKENYSIDGIVHGGILSQYQ